MRSVRRVSATLMAGLLAVALASCAQSERSDAGGQSGAAGGGTGGTLVFGAPGAPDNFDPAFAQDGETFRPAPREPLERVVHLDRGDRAPGDPLLQAAPDHLDLGQLGHGVSPRC